MSRLLSKCADEPFRLFFPLGVLLSLIGVLYWPLTIYHVALNDLPIEFHVWMQIYGFLWCFILGFLGTALPRLTQTKHFQTTELLLLLSLLAGIVISLFRDRELHAHIFFSASLIAFVMMLAKRFLKRQKSPPVTFIFIPFAFLSALIGSLLMIALHNGFDWHFTELYELSRNLLTLGFVTFLLMGIGGFLIRSILGWGQVLAVSEAEIVKSIPSPTSKQMLWHGTAANLLLISFAIEAFWQHTAGQVLRAAVVSVEFLTQMRIYKVPVSGKVTSNFLNLSLWLFLIGLWGRALFPDQYRLSFLHLCLIGGFSLSTFSVATRVILSHCGHSQLLHQAYRPFTAAGILILIGLGARFAADFNPGLYQTHLAYAGVAWALGVSVWSAFVLSKAVRQTLS